MRHGPLKRWGLIIILGVMSCVLGLLVLDGVVSSHGGGGSDIDVDSDPGLVTEWRGRGTSYCLLAVVGSHRPCLADRFRFSLVRL